MAAAAGAKTVRQMERCWQCFPSAKPITVKPAGYRTSTACDRKNLPGMPHNATQHMLPQSVPSCPMQAASLMGLQGTKALTWA